jgi:hypothetical protein
MKLHWPRFRMAGIEGGMLTLLARGGLPGLRVGWNTLMAPSLTARGDPVAWPVAAIRGDSVRPLPWRLLAQPPHHPAGHAKPQHRQHHPDSRPQRPARHHHQHTGQGPDHRAVQQPGQLGLSQWLPVGAGHERLQRSTQHRAGAALAGQRVDPKLPASHRAPPPRSSPWPRWVRRVPPPRRRNHEATTPKRTRSPAWALQRHLTSADAAGRGRMPPLAGRSDRCGVGSGRVPGHGPGGTRQPL